MSSSHPLRRLLAVLALVGLVAAGCGNSDDDDDDVAEDEPTTETTEAGDKVAITDVPGVTDDEIRVAAFGTNSNNPLGTCILDCYVDGIEAYFAYRNSEGGVHGRELTLATTLDDELGKNQQRAIEIVAAEESFAAFSATQLATGWKEIAKAGMPLFGWNIHPTETAGQTAIFGNQGTICITCTRRQTAYIAELAGAKKVASLGYGISENSKKSAQTVVDTIERYGEDIGGAGIAYENFNLAFGLPNGIAPEVTAMKRAGVDLVTASIDLNGMKTLAQEMERQGMGDVPMLHANTYDAEFVKEAGDLFEGDYVGVSFRPFEAGGESLDLFTKWMEETGSDISEPAMYGWINADTLYEGLKAAGPSFDQQKVIDALNEIEDYTAGGLIAPLDFGRQHDAPTEEDPATHGNDPDCFAFVQIKSGKFSLVEPSSKTKPFVCWPGDTRDWSEPEATDFE
jgi:ABC-type branched-subunit amino acid transport system substrate-binding protein